MPAGEDHHSRFHGTRSRAAAAAVAGALMLVAAACSSPATHQAGPSTASTRAAAHTPSAVAPTPSGSVSGASPSPAPAAVSITAVGDVIMGAAPALPPHDGKGFFADVKAHLRGDVVLGNVDESLTDRQRSDKCAPHATDCFAFRVPPSYAVRLAGAGFTVINLANNHSHDFGETGLADTRRALSEHGVHYTGMPGQITIQKVGRLRVAIIGFAPYGWAQSLLDIPGARQVVQRATHEADIVVVTMHAGAEGADKQHVRPGTETFLGENRGDPMAFTHAVIDAGADIVVGSGPHVLRGMQWYHHRLIAYSMGNFAGYHALSQTGPLGIGGILTVQLRPDGTWVGGRLTGTRMVGPGLPAMDPRQRARPLVSRLSREDFGRCGVRISAAGALNQPTC